MCQNNLNKGLKCQEILKFKVGKNPNVEKKFQYGKKFPNLEKKLPNWKKFQISKKNFQN